MNLVDINKRLTDLYGKTLDNFSNFKLVWSTEQREKRLGTFNDYFGNIFLRTVTEVREVAKYPFYPDQWILERLIINTLGGELVVTVDGTNKYTYEPIWVFKNKGGILFVPAWKHVEFIVHKWIETVENANKITPQSRIGELEKQDEEELKLFEEIIAEDEPTLGFAHDSAIAVPRNFERSS